MLTRAVLQHMRVLTQHNSVVAHIGRSLYNLELTSAHRQLIGQCWYGSSVGVQHVTEHCKNERNKDDNERHLTATERLQQLDEQGLKKLKVLKLEYEVMQMREPEAVPESMTDEQWLQILEKNSVFGRKRQYSFWVRKEKYQRAEEEKKRKRTEYVKERLAQVEESERNNEVGNRFLPRVSEAHMDRFYLSKLANALLHQNPTLILDMGYENSMSMREINNLHEQFWFLYGQNKRIKLPFNLVACSVNPVGKFMERFKKVTRNMNPDTFYCEMTEKSYLDLYPQDRLVYLTPDSRKVLRYFDPDDIYIIGGLVDISQIKPLSFTKAKKQGIRMASLPLDEYLRFSFLLTSHYWFTSLTKMKNTKYVVGCKVDFWIIWKSPYGRMNSHLMEEGNIHPRYVKLCNIFSWQKGSKALTLDQMINILGELMISGDWKRALQHVPQRKVCNPLYGDHSDTQGNPLEEAADERYHDKAV